MKKLDESDLIFEEKFLSKVEEDLEELLYNGWIIISSSISERQFIATLIK